MIDGVEITQDLRVSFETGDVAPVPVLLGFNKNEGEGTAGLEVVRA